MDYPAGPVEAQRADDFVGCCNPAKLMTIVKPH